MLHTSALLPGGGRTHGEVDVSEAEDVLRVWQTGDGLRKAAGIKGVDLKTAWR
jgi:hypothetical protein